MVALEGFHYTVEYRYNAAKYVKITTSSKTNYIWQTLVQYELKADAPCPALMGEPWDIYFELYGDNVLRYIEIWLYCKIPA